MVKLYAKYSNGFKSLYNPSYELHLLLKLNLMFICNSLISVSPVQILSFLKNCLLVWGNG